MTATEMANPTLPPLIGLSGYARTGKDEVAKILVSEYGYERRAFADALRKILYALNPVVGWNESWTECEHYRMAEIVDEIGWEAAKTQYDEVRRLLQRLGTEAGRNVLGDDIWVNTCLANRPPLLVIPDVRFPNEKAAIEGLGGHVIRISRPGVTAVNAHVSEKALDGEIFTYGIDNNGTLGDLATRVRLVVGLMTRTEVATQ